MRNDWVRKTSDVRPDRWRQLRVQAAAEGRELREVLDSALALYLAQADRPDHKTDTQGG